jgi:hypothetical protein
MNLTPEELERQKTYYEGRDLGCVGTLVDVFDMAIKEAKRVEQAAEQE